MGAGCSDESVVTAVQNIKLFARTWDVSLNICCSRLCGGHTRMDGDWMTASHTASSSTFVAGPNDIYSHITTNLSSSKKMKSRTFLITRKFPRGLPIRMSSIPGGLLILRLDSIKRRSSSTYVVSVIVVLTAGTVEYYPDLCCLALP